MWMAKPDFGVPSIQLSWTWMALGRKLSSTNQGVSTSMIDGGGLSNDPVSLCCGRTRQPQTYPHDRPPVRYGDSRKEDWLVVSTLKKRNNKNIPGRG